MIDRPGWYEPRQHGRFAGSGGRTGSRSELKGIVRITRTAVVGQGSYKRCRVITLRERIRRRIWETLFPPGVPCEPDLDFASLVRRFWLAGGNIRNILVGAACLAAADGKAITMAHLLHGTRRELQKMGRLVSDGELALR